MTFPLKNEILNNFSFFEQFFKIRNSSKHVCFLFFNFQCFLSPPNCVSSISPYSNRFQHCLVCRHCFHTVLFSNRSNRPEFITVFSYFSFSELVRFSSVIFFGRISRVVYVLALAFFFLQIRLRIFLSSTVVPLDSLSSSCLV